HQPGDYRPGDFNPERLILDDELVDTTPMNVGDEFETDPAGVLHYSFGNFKLFVTGDPGRVDNDLDREITDAVGPQELAVATVNVENLHSPDLIAIEEMQDNSGFTDDGTVAADQSWERLIEAIDVAGGPVYDYRQIDPENNADGGAPGGNIRVGFLFRTDIGLTFAPGTAGGSTTAVSVSSSGNSADPVAVSHNPGRIDPTDSAFSSSRKPLVGKFFFNGEPVFVIGNHWNSKGGDNPLFGRYQPPVLSSATQRGQQADLVAAFVDDVQAIDPVARVVVAGDLNDFEYSAAVQKLVTAGLTDLPAELPDSERYGYVYEGNSQVLDHLLISGFAAHSYDVVHVNAEFADQLSDHDPSVVRLTL
ncbi:endonuclease/exonuclease/phosphatase family protein, partial [Actinokineospora sp.]|uniref:endonuclease/exonuclease/phosphatase family protein n=1 Tax=Actinokineospora sp. TaxID=1872133 RepID=UPI003D6AC90C